MIVTQNQRAVRFAWGKTDFVALIVDGFSNAIDPTKT
jgi:hypothetical protein